jgi:hypothetical protein
MGNTAFCGKSIRNVTADRRVTDLDGMGRRDYGVTHWKPMHCEEAA